MSKKEKVHYDLTFWQRVQLVLIWFYWIQSDSPTRKTWHEVKKGMEKHKHNYVVLDVTEYNGRNYDYYNCDHEGCNYTSPYKSE